jgi:hypothetical protein
MVSTVVAIRSTLDEYSARYDGGMRSMRCVEQCALNGRLPARIADHP